MYNMTLCNVLQRKHQLEISKWRRVKTWITFSTFFYIFLKWHSKKRKKSSFLDFEKKT